MTVESRDNWVYTPGENYHGSDSFTYTANDGPATSSPATVSVTVTPENDAPEAGDTSATTKEDTEVTVDPPVPSDPDGDDITVVIVDEPQHGTAVVSATGKLRLPTPVDGLQRARQLHLPGRRRNPVSSSTATVSITVV